MSGSPVKCRSCGVRIGGNVERYRTTLVSPNAVAWAGKVLGWTCVECGDATEQVYIDNRARKKQEITKGG